MEALPGKLVLNEGRLTTSVPAIRDVAFGGGQLEISASARAISKISSLSVADGVKARIKLSNLYLLPKGEYTIVEAGNALGADDYEFESDPAVEAVTAVGADGSVVLTVGNLREGAYLYWRPQELTARWDEDDAAWMKGASIVPFADGEAVMFDGTEENYIEEIRVENSPKAKEAVFDGEKDYTLIGEEVQTLYVSKKGSGTLAIDGKGFSSREIALYGGEVQFRPNALSYVSGGIAVNVAEGSRAAVSLDVSHGSMVPKLFQFKYNSGSASWDSTTTYAVSTGADSIASIVGKASPVAPDGVSLSGKSVYFSGFFHVAEEEAGDWSFKGIYDDGIALWIDREKVFQTDNWQDEKTASVNLSEGWHLFEVRAYDGSGGWGHNNALRAQKPGASQYLHFHEQNFNMDWRGSEADPSRSLSDVKIKLTVADGAELEIRSAGYVVESLELGAGAKVSIDPQTVPANRTFISADDPEVLNILKEQIQSSLGTVGTVVETADGLAWEMEAVFDSATVTDLMDENGWMNGVVPGIDEDVVIAGASTRAVMDGNTTMFNSISVQNGATLSVNAGRDLPALDLSAGCTLEIAGTVISAGAFSTVGEGEVTVHVADGCSLDLSDVPVSTDARLVKTGAGDIIFGDTVPALLKISEGALVLKPYVGYEMVGVELGENAVVKISAGDTILPGVAVPQGDKRMFVARFTYIGRGSWADVGNWACGELPGAGDAVYVYGEGTELLLDGGEIAMPASIAVEGGAELQVRADVSLPPLTVQPASKVVFGDNETQPAVAAVLDASLTTVADATVVPVALPVVEIATNATVTVGGDMKFKNIDLRLYGKLSKSSNDAVGPTFGYAADGETSYIAFISDGGEFDIHAATGSDPRLGQLNFLCPEPGGTVIAVGTVVLRNSTRRINGWNDMGDVRFGSGNPMREPFAVLIDGTHVDVSGKFYAEGAAHLSLVNGAYIRRAPSCLGHGWAMAIGGAATVSVAAGSYIDFTAGGGSAFAIDSQAVVDAVIVGDGGVYNATYNTSGRVQGVFVGDGGVLGVGKLYEARVRTDLLRGFGSARIDGGLDIASLNIGTGNKDWDRHAKMANLPFTGTGDVTITNGVPARPFTVTMVNGANTATGTIRVAKADGDAETALFFADGANWAGTVVAGNVSLTNLNGSACAASVDFGRLDLSADFPVRVWRGADGTLVNDTLNVGAYLNNGGRIAPVMMTEGDSFAFGDKIVLGKVRKGAPLPHVAWGWTATAEEIEGDGDHVQLILARGRGFMIIVR